MKTDYEKYRFTILEWVRYLGEGLLLCIVVNGLCYQKLSAFCFMLPVPVWYIRRKKKQLIRLRKKNLHHQFKDVLNSINAAVAAGYSLENAVREAKKDLTDIYGEEKEMTKELTYICTQMELSVSVEKLFFQLGVRSGVEDIRNFSEILAQSKRMGGNMKEVIQNCVKVMEGKIEVKKEIDAMVASRKMEHTVMGIMPAAIILYMHMTSPGFLDPLYHNSFGAAFMTLCLMVYAGAYYWGGRIVHIEV